MRLSKGPIAISFLLVFVLVMSAVFSRAVVTKQQSETPNFNNFPIVDLAAQPPKITLPTLFFAWFVDAIIIIYSVAVFFM